MTTGFDIAVGASNIGAFVLQIIGLKHLRKDPDLSTLRDQARFELTQALDILDQYHTVVDDDLLAPLVARYKR